MCDLSAAWPASRMFLINPLAGRSPSWPSLALAAALAPGTAGRWGDARRGIYEALFRWALVRSRTAHRARNWRPHLLVFVVDPVQRSISSVSATGSARGAAWSPSAS